MSEGGQEIKAVPFGVGTDFRRGSSDELVSWPVPELDWRVHRGRPGDGCYHVGRCWD